MRLRHTSRTDPAMSEGRRQVSFRLDQQSRERFADIIADRKIPDIRSISDILQDASWLWLYEYDKEIENGRGARTPGNAGDSVGGRPEGDQEAQRVALGDAP